MWLRVGTHILYILDEPLKTTLPALLTPFQIMMNTIHWWQGIPRWICWRFFKSCWDISCSASSVMNSFCVLCSGNFLEKDKGIDYSHFYQIVEDPVPPFLWSMATCVGFLPSISQFHTSHEFMNSGQGTTCTGNLYSPCWWWWRNPLVWQCWWKLQLCCPSSQGILCWSLE